MSNVRIKLNEQGVRKLLKSEEMQKVTSELGEEVKRRAGGDPGYLVTTRVGKNRCNTSVAVTDYGLLKREMKNNTLIKSLRG